MLQQVEIRVSDFSITPGGRYEKDYLKSGEEFYKTILEPKLLDPDLTVVLNLDRVVALPSSFLDEIFTRAVEKLGKGVGSRLSFVAPEKPARVDDAKYYLDRALKHYGR